MVDASMNPKARILFVCTGNTCRSPMAEALFNQKNLPGWEARSAGLAAFDGSSATALASAVMCEHYGIDLSGHRSRQVTEQMLADAALIVTMTGSQAQHLQRTFPLLNQRIQTLGSLAGQPGLDVMDPFGGDITSYAATASVLSDLVARLAAGLRIKEDPGQDE